MRGQQLKQAKLPVNLNDLLPQSRGKAMPLCVCVRVCVGPKILKNASSKVAKAFTDDIVNEENNQHSQIRTFLYLIQVQAVLYAIISATSYYRFQGSTPFKIAHGSYGQQCNSYLHTQKYRWNLSGNVRRGTQGKYLMNTL